MGQPKRRWPRCLSAILAATCLVASAHGADTVRVLLLFGSPDVGLWSRTFTDAFFGHPGVDAHQPPLSVTTEYLGFYAADAEAVERTVQLLDYRQRRDPADIVVAVQGPAGRFLADYGDSIYPGVERLYVLPGREVAGEVAGRADTAVLRSAIADAIAGTLTTIARVMPEVDTVLVITGAGDFDAVYLDYAHVALDGRAGVPRVQYLHDLDLAALEQRLARASPHTAAVLLTYEADPAGHAYRTVIDVLPRLLSASSIPIFAAYDTMLGEGVVGGVMTSTTRYGYVAAETVLSLAQGGTRPALQPSPPTRMAFDWPVLRRFGIDPARLPLQSEIVNRSLPAYGQYLWEILATVAVILVQALLIATLWRSSLQRRRAARVLRSQARDLERQKVLFESVINSIQDAIVITSVDGTIIASNEQGFRDTFGFAPSRVIGRDCGVLAVGRSFAEFERALAREPRIVEFAAAAGETFPGEWVGTRILSDSGEHLGCVLLVRNVAERIAHEEERRQAHKMEALGSLAGGIAHDFNNILTVILGSAELIQAGASAPAESAEQIVRAGGRARELIGQILAFSRRGSGRDLAPVDLRALLDETLQFLKASLPSSILLDASERDDLGVVVEGSESQLQQVLLNLCANARDAMGVAGGRLSIRVTRRTVRRGFVASQGAVRRGHYVCVDVSDTGSGISPALQQRVFDPFFTTKDPGQGTGMGLALVYGIVQAHRGAINLTSVPGEGSRFTLFLPELRERRALPRSEGDTSPLGRGERVLLIEDDEAVLATTEEMLAALRYEVESHVRPQSALAAFSSHPERYAAVVTVQTLPHVDGLAVCRALRTRRADIPVILCSGLPIGVDSDRFESPSNVVILAKPYRAVDLAMTLRRLLDATAGTVPPSRSEVA